MRAMVFHGPGDLRHEEVPLPLPEAGGLVMKVEAALTCGTDVKTLRRGHPVMIPRVPTVFGHEFAGTVSAVGAGVPVETMLAEERSLLDLVGGDVTRMRARLAGPERAKMDQYLESLRGVERQLGELARGSSCPTAVSPGAALDRGGLDADVIAAHVAVTFAAQQCGLTRVSHVSIHGYSSPHIPYKWLGDRGGCGRWPGPWPQENVGIIAQWVRRGGRGRRAGHARSKFGATSYDRGGSSKQQGRADDNA